MRDGPQFNFDEDARMLKSAAQVFLDDRVRAGMVRDLGQRVRRDPETVATKPDVWRDMVSLGWTGLGVTEDCGGIDASLSAIAGLVEELGRAAAPVPLVSTLCACFLLRACSGRAATDCLTRIAAGAGATLAFADKGGGAECSATDVVVRGGRLEGSAWYVQNACEVEWFVVSARDEANGIGWYVLHRDAVGLRVVADEIGDLTRTQGRVIFDGTAVSDAEQAAAHHEGAGAFGRALPALLTLVAADICGAAEWLLQTTADYANTRTQFGRKIGGFQALRHQLANLANEVEPCRGMYWFGAYAQDSDPARATHAASLAKAHVGQRYLEAARSALEYHGGIGFTWEYDSHIWLKRAMLDQTWLGNADAHYLRAADHAGW